MSSTCSMPFIRGFLAHTPGRSSRLSHIALLQVAQTLPL
jgi:hypothetical protein